MSDPFSRLAQNDPERLIKALQTVLPLMQKNRAFLQQLEAEKGKNHVIVADMLFSVFDLTGLIAMYVQRLEDNDPSFTRQERDMTKDTILHLLSGITQRVARGLGLSREDFNDLSDAAKAQMDATFELVTRDKA